MENRTQERPARPDETCTCGRPATIVYITAGHGEVPYCGVPHAAAPAPSTDDRFTWAMVIEVFDVLERHGYRKASDAAGGRAVGALLDLIAVYEGQS